MMRVYITLLMVVVACHSVIGQLDDEERPDQWTAKDMPNPKRNPQHCRLIKPGFICDPDALLGDKHRETLDWLLRGFYDNDTLCPCSTFWCEKHRKGTHMSVALVKKLKVPVSNDPETAVMQAASGFALDLERLYWHDGTCRNSLVLVYSRDDGVLFISQGPTTQRHISRGTIENIQRAFGFHFRGGANIFAGIGEIVIAVRSTLNGNDFYDSNTPQQLIGGANHVMSGVLATISFAFLSFTMS